MATSSTSRLDSSNWTNGQPVNLFTALGFSVPAGFKYPALTATLAAQSEAAQTSATGNTSLQTSASSSNQSTSTLAKTEAANQTLGQQLAAVYGWSTGPEWTALNAVVMAESGWNNTAQNPHSTAYGIGQFLNTTWATVGGTKTSNATTQIKLMLQYIKQRYGTPQAAWAHELAYGWY
jgi:hypothetical protein